MRFFQQAFTVNIAFLLLLIVAGCQKNEPPQETVRIGLIPYTTDEHYQRVGLPTENAARMAVNEINALGGLKINSQKLRVELVVEGIASNPEHAVAAMRKLTNLDNVAAIVGLQYSVDAIPAGAFAEKSRIPFISPMSTNHLTTAGRDYVFRMSFVDDLQGRVMAHYAFDELGAQRAAILYDRADPYSAGIAAVFTAAFIARGGSIVASESFAGKTSDYSGYGEVIKAAAPDVLYLPGFATDVLKQARTIRNLGLQVRLLGADGWNATEFSRITDFNDSFMTTHWSKAMPSAGTSEFVAYYASQFGVEPDVVAALTYDSMKILFLALEKADTLKGSSVRQSLVALPPYVGVTGTVDFIQSGDPVKGVVILQLQNGQAVFRQIVNSEGAG